MKTILLTIPGILLSVFGGGMLQFFIWFDRNLI